MSARASLFTLAVVALSGACAGNHLLVGSNPDGSTSSSGTAGSGAGGSATSGASGASGLPAARIGDDGVCGMTICPQGQQCCLSTGRCVDPGHAASNCPLPTPMPTICAGVTCAVNQICCLLNGKCIDPSTATTSCPKPSASTTDASSSDSSTEPSSTGQSQDGTSVPCGSNADCRPTQFCATSSSLLCLGPGVCESRSNCGASTGTQKFCGCDGVTYSDIQTPCRVGVRIIPGSLAACGAPDDAGIPGTSLGPRDPVIYCGTSDQCPKGQSCCSITNRCYDTTIPYLCTFPPPGTSLPCLEDRQCGDYEFCFGAGCSGPGGCVSPGSCGGELTPVCGCDGKSYTSAGCARAAPVRVAHDGVCGGADAGI